MNINPGELNKKIDIVSVGTGKDSDGYPVITRTTILSKRPAKFSRTSGTELIKASADFSSTSARFLIRYTSTVISRKMIVVYDYDYEIEYVNDYEDKHEYIEIIASRLTNG